MHADAAVALLDLNLRERLRPEGDSHVSAVAAARVHFLALPGGHLRTGILGRDIKRRTRGCIEALRTMISTRIAAASMVVNSHFGRQRIDVEIIQASCLEVSLSVLDNCI
jgi:hypothetical protein